MDTLKTINEGFSVFYIPGNEQSFAVSRLFSKGFMGFFV
jgi:hypothetical protein